MELSDYTYAWMAYIAAAGCILLSQLSLLSVFAKRWVAFLILVSAIVLLWPYRIGSYQWRAPAITIVFIDYFLQKGQLWPLALQSLLKAIAVVIFGYLIFLFAMMLRDIERQRQHKEHEAYDEDDYADEPVDEHNAIHTERLVYSGSGHIASSTHTATTSNQAVASKHQQNMQTQVAQNIEHQQNKQSVMLEYTLEDDALDSFSAETLIDDDEDNLFSDNTRVEKIMTMESGAVSVLKSDEATAIAKNEKQIKNNDEKQGNLFFEENVADGKEPTGHSLAGSLDQSVDVKDI